jgi:putative transposase
VGTRNYEQVINGYSEKLGVSRSSVSRAFIRASQKDLDSINEGKLDAYRFVALMMDSLEIGGRTVVAALGITAEMEKIPIGLREGDTENSEVVKDLLNVNPRTGLYPVLRAGVGSNRWGQGAEESAAAGVR